MKSQVIYFQLFSLLVLTAGAAQTELSPANFKESISQGVWQVLSFYISSWLLIITRLVEYHSPYCPHCREFAPTWARLHAENEKLSDPGIHLAQVNCAIHGGTYITLLTTTILTRFLAIDFCKDSGVQSYPQVNLYRAGSHVEVYKGHRDFDHLHVYIGGHAEPTTSTLTSPSLPYEPTLLTTAEHLDYQAPRGDANPSGTVLVLDAINFDKVVEQGPVFVKFFAPW
jgi:thioredoxin domain-containing protein 5